MDYRKEKAEKLRQRAAMIAEAAGGLDDFSQYEAEMAEAAGLRAEANRLDPPPLKQLKTPQIQLCVLCNKIAANKGWKVIERQMALCPDCEDATPEDLRLTGRRLFHAAKVLERQA